MNWDVLRKKFLNQYNMCLNPQKWPFEFTSGKLLRYVVSLGGIDIDPSKIKATQEMQPPKTEKEI